MQQKLKQIAIWLIAFLVMFFAVKGFRNYYFEEVTLKNIQSNVEEKLDKINNPIVEEGGSKSQAVVDSAISNAKESLDSANSESQKLQKAVDMFRGFYLVNAIARPRFCLKYNVRIDSFVKAFEKEHAKEYAFMKNYESTNQQITAKLYEMLNDLLDKQVAIEMSNTAKEYKMEMEIYCKTFETNANDYIQELKISKRMPEIYQLMNK